MYKRAIIEGVVAICLLAVAQTVIAQQQVTTRTVVQPRDVINDPFYNQQYYLENANGEDINVREVWHENKGEGWSYPK